MIPPDSHWRTRLEQRLYVAFCELASSILDYAAGADTLETAKVSPARLNWAATSLYYSIVHTARLLVFVPYGDFPTSHAHLPTCFDGRSVSTAWLSKLLRQTGVPPARRTGAEVDSATLQRFWEQAGVADAHSKLANLASALRNAKELRNENNYESLLIAHEFRHTGLTALFLRLTTAMRSLAASCARIGAYCFACYLTTRPPREQAFVVRYCRNRIIEPIREWHSETVQHEVEALLQELLQLDISDQAGADAIDLLTSRTYFNEKEGLLADFESKVAALEATLT